MEKKKLYEGPEISVFSVVEILSTAEGSREIGGEYPDAWE